MKVKNLPILGLLVLSSRICAMELDVKMALERARLEVAIMRLHDNQQVGDGLIEITEIENLLKVIQENETAINAYCQIIKFYLRKKDAAATRYMEMAIHLVETDRAKFDFLIHTLLEIFAPFEDNSLKKTIAALCGWKSYRDWVARPHETCTLRETLMNFGELYHDNWRQEDFIIGALMQRDLELVRIFLSQGFDVNSQSLNGDTALHCAVDLQNCVIGWENALKPVILLLNAGSHPYMKNKKGELPIDLSSDERVSMCLLEAMKKDAASFDQWILGRFKLQKNYLLKESESLGKAHNVSGGADYEKLKEELELRDRQLNHMRETNRSLTQRLAEENKRSTTQHSEAEKTIESLRARMSQLLNENEELSKKVQAQKK